MWAKMDSNHRSRKTADLQSAPFGHSGIRPKIIEPMEGFEPTTPRLQITCSGQLSYIGKLHPSTPPALSRDCCIVSVVNTPNIKGIPNIVFNFVMPIVTP